MRQPLGNAWYCVGQSRSLGRTGLRAVELNGEQIVLGRTPDGTPFALRDRERGTQVGQRVAGLELPACLVEVEADDRQQRHRGDPASSTMSAGPSGRLPVTHDTRLAVVSVPITPAQPR